MDFGPSLGQAIKLSLELFGRARGSIILVLLQVFFLQTLEQTRELSNCIHYHRAVPRADNTRAERGIPFDGFLRPGIIPTQITARG
jgi:hypothetical protein